MATRCFSPPLSFRPRSPTMVSKPSGMRWMADVSWAIAAHTTSAFLNRRRKKKHTQWHERQQITQAQVWDRQVLHRVLEFLPVFHCSGWWPTLTRANVLAVNTRRAVTRHNECNTLHKNCNALNTRITAESPRTQPACLSMHVMTIITTLRTSRWKRTCIMNC
jgi:hypothetical protein